jgi:hypothetical protein
MVCKAAVTSLKTTLENNRKVLVNHLNAFDGIRSDRAIWNILFFRGF